MYSNIFLFNCSVVSNSLWPRGLQHTRLLCPSLSPGVCENSCPLSQWYYQTIPSSVTPCSSCLQSFPASGSFLLSQFFTSGGKRIRTSASVLPMNVQGWFPFGLTGFILLSKGLSRVFSWEIILRWKQQNLKNIYSNYPSVSCSVVSNSLWPHGL